MVALRLTGADGRDRRFLDARFARAIHHDTRAPVRISAHRDLSDALQGIRPIDFDRAANPPGAYQATLAVPSLSAPDRIQPRTTVAFDLTGAGWPYKPPPTWIVGPRPWNPHVRPQDGYVCTHVDFDHSQGGTFLVDLIRSLGLALNYQEPQPTPDAHFYNLDALEHWRRRNWAPLHRELLWPDVIYGAGLRGPAAR